jgi:PilZ domain
MSELARTFVGRLRAFIRDRRTEKRRSARLPFNLSILDLTVRHNGPRGSQSVDGHTLDVSSSGLSLIVPVIRLGEHYLVGEGRRLKIKLELPVGPVEIESSPVRYERLEEGDEESGYLIGVRITRMRENDRARYNEYLKKLLGS